MWTNPYIWNSGEVVDDITLTRNATTNMKALLGLPTTTSNASSLLNPVRVGQFTRIAPFSAAVSGDFYLTLPFSRLKTQPANKWTMNVNLSYEALTNPPSSLSVAIRRWSAVPAAAGATTGNFAGDALALAYVSLFNTPTETIVSPTPRRYNTNVFTVPFSGTLTDDLIVQVRLTPVAASPIQMKNVMADVRIFFGQV